MIFSFSFLCIQYRISRKIREIKGLHSKSEICTWWFCHPTRWSRTTNLLQQPNLCAPSRLYFEFCAVIRTTEQILCSRWSALDGMENEGLRNGSNKYFCSVTPRFLNFSSVFGFWIIMVSFWRVESYARA